MSVAPSLPEVGQEIAERYVLERRIGEGGMGLVFAARDRRLDRDVAIKFLKADDVDSSDARARFIREAKAAGALKSENAVAIFDTGIHPPSTPYIVMERLNGEDVAALLCRRGRLSIREAVDIVLQACRVLGEAHALRIVHRDIKPSNLFVTRRNDGTMLVKVLDFGLAKAVHDTQLTQSLVALGSPRYMSPEQVRSVRSVDTRTDVWSIAIVLYELIAGRPPFRGANVPAVAAAIVSDAPVPLSKRVPDVPEALSNVIARALVKDPNARTATMEDFASALRELVPESTSGTRYILPSHDSAPDAAFDAELDDTHLEGTRSSTNVEDVSQLVRKPMFKYAVLAASVAALGAGASVMLGTRPDDARTRAPSASAAGVVFSTGVPERANAAPAPALSSDATAARASPSSAPSTASASPSSSASASKRPGRPSQQREKVERPSAKRPLAPAASDKPTPAPVGDEPPGRDRP